MIKKSLLLIGILFVISCTQKEEITQVVEISCGQCNFDMPIPKSCDLAVRIDGIPYYVDNANIDDFGDAHEKDKGFCEVIRKAKIAGLIVGNRFKAISIKLL